VADRLRTRFVTDLDITGSVGKRYRRQDEVGTPYCVTADFDTIDDNQVTIRERDSMDQERVPVDALPEHLAKRFEH
jgi:glycyl-tRNA synthetase